MTDLRADLNSAFDAAEAAEAPQSTNAPVDTPEVAEEPAEALEAVETNADEEAVKSPAEVKADDNPLDTKSETIKTEDDRIPSGLKAGIKAKWSNLDADVKAEIRRLDDNFHKGIAEYKQGHQFGSEVYNAIQPFMATLQSIGAAPVQAIQHLFAVDHTLRYGSQQAKAQQVMQIAQQYGVDLAQLQAPDQRQVDPYVADLESRLNSVQQTLTQRQQYEQQQLMQDAQRQYMEFAGNPENIYIENVKEDMAHLLNSGQAKTLPEAYEKACWQHPEVRPILIQKQLAEEQRKAIESAQRKTANARQASFDVKGSGTVTKGKTTASTRSILESLIPE